MPANTLPFSGLRIVELESNLLSGRLTGMLFADQGAEVIILNSHKGEQARLTDGSDEAERRANDMLNRNKVKPRSFTPEVLIHKTNYWHNHDQHCGYLSKEILKN